MATVLEFHRTSFDRDIGDKPVSHSKWDRWYRFRATHTHTHRIVEAAAILSREAETLS